MTGVISKHNASVRLNGLRSYYKNRLDITDDEFLRFIHENKVTEYDRIRLKNSKSPKITINDLWIGRNATRLRHRNNSKVKDK